MSRWINADAMIARAFQDSERLYLESVAKHTPSIDIVRCKECKWAKANGAYQWCGRLDSTARITADDYCSYGARKESE